MGVEIGDISKLVAIHAGFETQSEDADFIDMAKVRPESPEYLWEPYLRLKQVNIVEAKGSSGKSTFLLAVAAALSNGILPFGGRCEPVTTLYYGREDDPGELRHRFDSLGGDASRLKTLKQLYEFDQRGLARMQESIIRLGARLIIIDPAKDFLPRWIPHEFDNVKISRWLGDIRDVSRSTSSAVVAVRHWSKETKNVALAHRGAGGDQWRNSARVQLVLVRHPGRPASEEYVGVFPCRGSINAPAGDPFGISNEAGQFQWIAPDDFDLAPFEQEFDLGQPSASAKGPTQAVVEDFLRRHVPSRTYAPVKELETLAKAAGINIGGGTWKRAKAKLCEAARFGDGWNVTLKEVDPFANES